jgi:hypothetical protein
MEPDTPMCCCGRQAVGYLIMPDGTYTYDEWCCLCDDDGGEENAEQNRE